MQKIVLDTNVLVSALISNAIPSRILYDLVLSARVKLCLSEEVFSEYVEVLGRDKFAKFSNFEAKAEIVLNKLRELAIFFEISTEVIVLKDVSDNKFLELAEASEANYLLTGNTLDFTISEFASTKILTPRAYWDDYAPKIV